MWHILPGHLESLYQVSQWGTKDRPWRETEWYGCIWAWDRSGWPIPLLDYIGHRTCLLEPWGLLLLSVWLGECPKQFFKIQSIGFSLSCIFSFHKYSHSCFDIAPKSCKIGDWPKRYDDFTVKNYHVSLESKWACLEQLNRRKGSTKCYRVVKEISKHIYIPSRIKMPF